MTLTAEQIEYFAGHRVARLATVDESGRPHALPVCFAVHDGRIYTPIDEKPKRADGGALRRVRNILTDPRVCLVVDHYEENWERLSWMQVRGRASLVEDAEERRAAHAALRERYPQYRAMDLESRALIGIDAERVVGWRGGG